MWQFIFAMTQNQKTDTTVRQEYLAAPIFMGHRIATLDEEKRMVSEFGKKIGVF